MAKRGCKHQKWDALMEKCDRCNKTKKQILMAAIPGHVVRRAWRLTLTPTQPALFDARAKKKWPGARIRIANAENGVGKK